MELELPKHTIIRVHKHGKAQSYWHGVVVDVDEDKKGNQFFNVRDDSTGGIRSVMPERVQVQWRGPQGGVNYTPYNELTGEERISVRKEED